MIWEAMPARLQERYPRDLVRRVKVRKTKAHGDSYSLWLKSGEILRFVFRDGIWELMEKRRAK